MLVGPVVEVVMPVIVKLEEAPQVAKGTGGAPVVAPVELQLDPFAKDNVATEPINEFPVEPRLTIPVGLTETKVPVPPVVFIIFEVLPAKFNVPEISPTLAVPLNAKATA